MPLNPLTRFLPGIAFPIGVFVVWRLAHLVVTVTAGGDAVESTFNWDGGYYRRILESGYAVSSDEVRPATAFFPLVSWVAMAPDLLMPRTAAMMLTANLAALAAFVTVWGAATAWRDERLGRASVVLLAFWPPSLFYWAFYSEAVFVASSAGAVWADRRGHRITAALLVAGAAMARSVGVLVGLVLAGVRVWRQRRIGMTAVLYAVAALIGIGFVMYAQHRQAGDALAFLKVQEDWGRSLTAPWVTLREGVAALRSGEPRLARWLDLVGITAIGVAMLWAFWLRLRQGRRLPLPAEAWLLTVAVLALPLASGVLGSMNRFVAGAWSGFVILAVWLPKADWRIRGAVYGLLVVASVFFVRYWADGVFIA